VIISLSHLAKELEQLGSDPNSTLWDALRLITAEFAEAAEKADRADMPFEAHYARIAADAIADASTFVEPEPKVVSVKTATEEENGYKLANLRVALNADANAKNSIQFEYNGEIAFDLAIENDPATISDSGISAKATIRTWPIEGGSGEEASVLLRHRGSEPTGS